MSDTAQLLDTIDTIQARPTYKLNVDNVSALILRKFNQSQIAEILNVSKQAVSAFIDRNQDILRPLIDNTDAILAQRFKRQALEYMNSIDHDDIKAASMLQRVTASGIAIDKYRLLSGQSNINIDVQGAVVDINILIEQATAALNQAQDVVVEADNE